MEGGGVTEPTGDVVSLELYCTGRRKHERFLMTTYRRLPDGTEWVTTTPYYLPPNFARVEREGWSWDSFSLLCTDCHRQPTIDRHTFWGVIVAQAIERGLQGLDVSLLPY